MSEALIMKKEQYERAELEVIRFETEDVILTSLDEYEDDILKRQG